MDIRTFEYLKPTDDQLQKMETLRHAFYDLACTIEALVPEGPDRTFALRGTLIFRVEEFHAFRATMGALVEFVSDDFKVVPA